eukprot:Plantae.Rhodophyta-Palmaria_palmata.ctg1928.p1 GENE.Plantae.Rhodophyta-Palmaria_palmata.ctg1928~~Plantae.Rhodophyta-Palmaria_palmata.ctg1928.p1  ORF type:complete len:386 (+),score=87.08 Plantae.Rhodophyta-Palmaria_palmata.ctg1928:96-1160(+)
MNDISDADLKTTVEAVLAGSDLQQMTLRKIMHALAESFECTVPDLSNKKAMVRAIVEDFLNAHSREEEDEESGASSSEEDVAEEVPPKKASGKRKKEEESEIVPQWKPVVLSGLSKAVVLDDSLADLLGVRVLGRSDIQKRVIAYVKEHGLQDEADKRNIVADDALKTVFKATTFTFFGLSKLISDHVSRVEDCDDDGLKELAVQADKAKLESMKAERAVKIANGESPPLTAAEKRKMKEDGGGKRQKRKRSLRVGPPSTTGLNAPMALSEGLSEVCGGEKILSRPQVVKALWTYIKANDLKDPNNGRNIICDEKLSMLFNNEKEVNGFGMNKYLTKHLTKIIPPPAATNTTRT